MEAGHRTAAREMRKTFIVWLLLASTDAGAVSLYPREVNVDTILFSLYESYEALCIQKGVKLSVEMEEKELPELKADPDRLIQVLRIFMDNAVRFSKKGSGIELQARALKMKSVFLSQIMERGFLQKTRFMSLNGSIAGINPGQINHTMAWDCP